MRDFYVVMRRDYQVASKIIDGVVINSYYPPGLEQGGQLALGYAGDALRIFNRWFGRYPYAEFDIVATPTTAGGVEYPGIVVVTERMYGLGGGFFEHAAVHEVAHQWWYGLVGNDQVEEPWLDESLTNYSAILYWEEIRGLEAASDVMANLFFGPYEQAKEQGRDRAVIGPVSAFSAGEYATFVYGKGPLFFHALRQEVGDETYFRIMQTYYTDHKYKIASAKELFNTIEQVSGRSVEPLIEMWLRGQ
jgi:aminopeptidase N